MARYDVDFRLVFDDNANILLGMLTLILCIVRVYNLCVNYVWVE